MKNMILFEWLPFRKKWSFYLMIILFFSLGLFTAKGANFPFPDVHRNAPYIISFVVALFSQISIFSVTILAAQVLNREQDANFQQVLYSTPVQKNQLLLSRFILIALVSVGLFFLLIAGLFIGHSITWIPTNELGKFNALHYLQPFLLFGLPNTILCTAIICFVGWISKNKLMIYLSGLLIYVLYIVIAIFSNSPLMATASPASNEAMATAAKIDPFGLAALFEQTKFWSPAQRNSSLLSFSGNLLFNRLAWMFAAACLLFIGLKTFRLQTGNKKSKRKVAETGQETVVPKKTIAVKTSPGSIRHSLQTIAGFIKIDLKSIIKGIPFPLVCLALVFLLGMEIYGTIEGGVRLPERYASTGLMVNTTLKTIPFFCLMAILFYSNELLWRSSNVNIASLENSSPVNTIMIFISKLLSLSIIPLVMILISIITGLVFQFAYSYELVDIKIYFSLFYLIGLPMMGCLAIIMSIQVFFRNKYIGIAVAAAFVLLTNTSLGKMAGLDNPLFRIGNSYDHLYSEMNGFGNYLSSFSWNIFYAISIALLLSLIAGKTWSGNNRSFLKRTSLIIFALPLLLLIASASYIFYQNNILHPTQTKQEKIKWKQEYESQYRRYASLPQPVINSVKTQIDLYPAEQRYEVKGTYWLQNKTAKPIDSLLIYFANDCKLENINIPTAYLLKKEERFGHYFYQFHQILAPLDSFKIDFQFSYSWNGFSGHQPFNAIVENGTFLRISNYFPGLGYQAGNEIDDEKIREEKNMGKASLLPNPEDSTENNHFINLDMLVSTDERQTAIGIGELEKQWQKNGRNFFRYKTSSPVPFRFAVSSAIYAIKKDHYNGKPIEVYFHPSHGENVDSLISGAKRTLAYCEKNFGPYPFPIIRFAEVSSFTKGFAGTAYPASIFMTENMVFHTNIKKSKQTNVISELTSHELAHQWWGGNLLQPANKKGRPVLTETLAMYTELMLNKQVADSAAIINLVKMYKGFYFSESVFSKENPLYKAGSEEAFLSYYKGIVVMYQLQLLMGEEKINVALRNLLLKHTYPLVPASTIDLLHQLYTAGTGDQRVYIDGLFKQIITHDIKINSAEVKTVADKKFELSFDIDILKYNTVDGKKILLQQNDSIDIGVYADDSKLFMRLPIINNKVLSKLTLGFKPVKIEADPYIKLMDAFDEDNVIDVH